MNLSNNALNGSIPNLFNMTSKILFVDFGNNRLTGSIPATLDALPIKGL